jgi:hypothetical protein
VQEVLLRRHEVVILGYLPGITNPCVHEVGCVLLHQFRLPAGAQVDEQFGPSRDLRTLDGPQDAHIHVALAVESSGQDMDAAGRGLPALK